MATQPKVIPLSEIEVDDELRADATQVLRDHWGYDDFRPAQAQLVASIMQGRDTLGVMPTGYGKSMCFQIPAILCEGTALVFSPLIALMKDQVDAAKSKGVKAECINSHTDEGEVGKIIDRFVEGEYDLLYVAPERIRAGGFRDAVEAAPISMIVVDEAHCVSQWGHDFRGRSEATVTH